MCRPQAQVLSKAAAKAHLSGVPHKARTDVPVIFFGTNEIAWLGAKDVFGWEAGMRAGFQVKGRKNKKFVVALEQARSLLAEQRPLASAVHDSTTHHHLNSGC